MILMSNSGAGGSARIASLRCRRGELDELEDHLRARVELELEMNAALAPTRAFAIARPGPGTVRAALPRVREGGQAEVAQAPGGGVGDVRGFVPSAGILLVQVRSGGGIAGRDSIL